MEVKGGGGSGGVGAELAALFVLYAHPEPEV